MPTQRPVDTKNWPEHKHLAINLRRMRAERGLSRQTLAEDSGTTAGSIGGLERCSGNPTYFLLLRIARALNITIVDLVRQPLEFGAVAHPTVEQAVVEATS